MISRLAKVVERGMTQGKIAEGHPRNIVMTLTTVLYGTIMFGCYVADEYDLQGLCAESLRNFLRGIRADLAPASEKK